LPTSATQEVTALLRGWSAGDPQAGADLIPIVYTELRRLAASYFAPRTLRPRPHVQTTALVHEAYLRLIDQRRVSWQNRAHFYGIAAQSMRRVLLDARTPTRLGNSSSTAALRIKQIMTTKRPPIEGLYDTKLAELTLGRGLSAPTR
jgi:RNA polymerase sigma factor (TIGR02999 family)